MESLHYGEMLGEYYINSGFYWGSTTGIYCAIFEGGGGRGARVRDYVLPRSEAQKVTLPSLKFEQAVICPDGPSPATGEG